jgi:hypothetical protein
LVVPVRARVDALIDSGSSVEKASSVKADFSMSFSITDDLAKTGTEPVTPAELEENILRGRAMTENLSKLSFPSLIIDKMPP